MKIGAVEIPALARLAPMAGITNAPFRLIARECGSGLTTSEEMDAAALLTGHPFADAIAAYYPAERPLAMQLLGKDPDLLARAAERCQVLGADIVDLNMGCPMPQITGKGKGAALMRNVETSALILRALRKAVSVPLTVKSRGCWDDEQLNAVEVAQMAEAEGVDAITVHPRTRSQRFTGRAPWTIIREVVEAVSVPVFFFQAEDGIRDHCVTGVQTCALPISSLRVDLGFASLKNCPKSLISSSAVWLSIVTTSSPTTKGNLLVGKAVRSIASIRTLQIGRASCRERV